MFDYYTFSLNVQDNQSLPELPGFFSAVAPRRASRIRAADYLVMLFTPSGNDVLSQPALDEIFQHLTKTYFDSSGTVTAAMRGAAEQLNTVLLERNLRNSREGLQISGFLNLAVLRHDTLYLAHVGATHSFVITKAHVQDFADPFATTRGAGVSRVVNLRYYQEKIEPGDLLVFSPDPPAAWTPAALAGSTQLTPDHLRRRFLSQCGPHLVAGIVQFQNGKGEIHRLRLRSSMPAAAPRMDLPPVPQKLVLPEETVNIPSSPVSGDVPVPEESGLPDIRPPSSHPDLEPSHPAGAGEFATLLPTSLPSLPSLFPAEDETYGDPVPLSPLPARAGEEEISDGGGRDKPPAEINLGEESVPVSNVRPVVRRTRTKVPAAPEAAPIPAPPAPEAAPKPSPKVKEKLPKKEKGPTIRQRLAKLWFASRASRQRSTEPAVETMLARLMPGTSTALPTISTGAILFIAVIVPILVVAVAMTVYFQKGQVAQQKLYIQQAQQFASQAAKGKDVPTQIKDWNEALNWLDKADRYGHTDESRALHNKVQLALDNLEGTIRLDMVPAVIGGFANSVKITRMVATDTDVYLLDSTQGRVLRIFQAGLGYQVDPQFKCGPGPAGGGIIIGKIIDMTPIPQNSPNKANLIAIDASGNILYCVEDADPVAKTLPQPQNYWGRITGIAYQNYTLYVLDAKLSSIWMFTGDANLDFSETPGMFFGNVVPKVQDVVDFDVFSDDLYMLHADGKMTKCTYSDFSSSPTHCTDPYPYMDERPGRKARPVVFPDTQFTQMLITQPYSIYLMDVKAPAVYHFSLALSMQQQLQPDQHGEYALPAVAPSAITVNPELSASRRLFLAYDNQVFYAPLP